MRLRLLCNYAPDAQQSMLRFGAMLEQQWRARGTEVTIHAPEPSKLTALVGTRGGAATRKWLGYFDKYVLFPRRLARAMESDAPSGGSAAPAVFHVVDHSNAVYIPQRLRPQRPWVVTCHDLLAVRGALGEPTDCPASTLGRRLQRAIVGGLSRASAIVADSESTLQDVDRLIPIRGSQLRREVLLGLSHPYHCVERTVARQRLAPLASIPWDQPFILHVGSNLPRKNKAGVLRVFARVAKRWNGNLVFCGAPLPPELEAWTGGASLKSRVFAAPGLSNPELEAAYSLAHALLYPSTCEGFGWPIIEAQACGCPVICSDRTSLPEVAGDGGLVHAVEDEAGMAEALQRLCEPEFRSALRARGTANLARFDAGRMIDGYGEVYEEVLAPSPSA